MGDQEGKKEGDVLHVPVFSQTRSESQKKTGRQIRMNPKVARGLPCLDGTQIPVTVFLELFKKGYTVDRIVTECYPELSPEDVFFAVDFIIDWVRRAPGYLSTLVDHS